MKSNAPKASTKPSSRQVGKQRRLRRKFITLLRIFRYGANNFTRNAWLSIAATAVMTITLLIVFSTVIARNLLLDITNDLESKISISIYLKTDTTSKQTESVRQDLLNLDSVEEVSIETSEEARTAFAQAHSSDVATIAAIQEATNKFPVTLHIKLKDIHDTAELQKFDNENANLQKYKDRNSSFGGERKLAIDSIGRATQFAETAGLIASAIFIVISSLIIFNTIRMAIYNRREEIEMMKLIGADKSFIRGPFVVEAMVYGFIAAFIATGAGIGLLYWLKPSLESAQIPINDTWDIVTVYAGLVLLAMIGVGIMIGIISSLLATRRYLKV